MNFLPIAFVDTFDLVASLPQRLGEFKGDGGRRVLLLRGQRKGAKPEADDAFVDAAVMRRWPELTNVLERIRLIGAQTGGIELGRIQMEMLFPGCALPWTKDVGAYAQRYERAHLALRVNPGCMLFAGAESLGPLPGNLTVANRRVLNSAINVGESPRVHLVVDFRRMQISDV